MFYDDNKAGRLLSEDEAQMFVDSARGLFLEMLDGAASQTLLRSVFTGKCVSFLTFVLPCQ